MKIHLPHPNKNVTVVSLVIIVALGLFSWGIVRYEQQRKHNQQVTAQSVATAKENATLKQQHDVELNAKLITAGQTKVFLCNFIATEVVKPKPALPPVCTQ